MSDKTKEYLTGILLGILISIMFFHKLCFGQTISEDEAELLAKVSQAESGNQDLDGRRLVVAVVLNRAEHPEFPDTIEEVLAQEGQFSTYKSLDSTTPTWQDRLAVRMELEQRSNDEVLFFRTSRYGTGTPMFIHGAHYFSGLKK